MAWTPHPDTDNTNSVELPDGWQICDGTKIKGRAIFSKAMFSSSREFTQGQK